MNEKTLGQCTYEISRDAYRAYRDQLRAELYGEDPSGIWLGFKAANEAWQSLTPEEQERLWTTGLVNPYALGLSSAIEITRRTGVGITWNEGFVTLERSSAHLEELETQQDQMLATLRQVEGRLSEIETLP